MDKNKKHAFFNIKKLTNDLKIDTDRFYNFIKSGKTKFPMRTGAIFELNAKEGIYTITEDRIHGNLHCHKFTFKLLTNQLIKREVFEPNKNGELIYKITYEKNDIGQKVYKLTKGTKCDSLEPKRQNSILNVLQKIKQNEFSRIHKKHVKPEPKQKPKQQESSYIHQKHTKPKNNFLKNILNKKPSNEKEGESTPLLFES